MSFAEKKENELVYMTSDILPVKNVFTTRYGGVSEGIYSSLNLGSNRGDLPEHVRENYRRLCSLLGVGIDDCAVTQQVHGARVRVVTGGDRHRCMSPVPYEADGIVTAEPGLPLLCFTADCVPVLLCDRRGSVAAAVHCGWRSSVQDILGVTVRLMCSMGARPESICAAIGPALGQCCFESDEDVPRAVRAWLGDPPESLLRPRADGKTMVDLKGANAHRLLQLGLCPEQIDISPECTYCSHDKYWSHRYTRGQRGSQASGIVL